ncbi:MAG: hypothetical protein AAF636_18990 [Pseudomonadota bacterium]
MFIITPSTIWNPKVLQMVSAPKRMLRRITLLPRSGVDLGLLARLTFEVQILRYLIPLLPFVAAMFIWPHLALPISQAPVPMMIAIAIFETRVLAVKRENRETVIDDAAMQRGEDALRFNATKILGKIAAGRDLHTENIMLVVEQSGLARVPPLTLVSVQEETPEPRIFDLTEEERVLIAQTLFDDDLSERLLHRITLRRNESLRYVSFDASTLSAHARIAARVAQTALRTDALEPS